MLTFLLTLVDDPRDKAALEFLYNTYCDVMMHTAMSILKDINLAEDIVHDAFVIVAEIIKEVDLYRNVRSFLITIVKNEAIDCRKRMKHEIMTYDDVGKYYAGGSDDTQNVIDRIDDAQLAASIIAALPPELSEVFILKYKDDLSCVQIAERMNISSDAVRKRLQRARQLIAITLKRRGL